MNLPNGAASRTPKWCMPWIWEQGARKRRAMLLNTATFPAEPNGAICAEATASNSPTTLNCGAWATKWTAPGRSVTATPRSTAGPRRKQPKLWNGRILQSNWLHAAVPTSVCRHSAVGKLKSWIMCTNTRIMFPCTSISVTATTTPPGFWDPAWSWIPLLKPLRESAIL